MLKLDRNRLSLLCAVLGFASLANATQGELQKTLQIAPSVPAASVSIKKYKITEAGLTLSQIAKIFYGKSKVWKDIAKWNNLEDPSRIRIGQVLILQNPANLSKNQIDHEILVSWRKFLDRREARENRKAMLADKGSQPKVVAKNESVPEKKSHAKKEKPHRNIAGEGDHPPTAPSPEAEADAKAKAEEEAKAKAEAEEKAKAAALADANLENDVLAAGEKLKKEENFQAELKVYTSFLKSHPKSIRVMLAQGSTYLKLKKYPDAQRCLHKARMLDPSQLQAWLKELASVRLQGFQDQEKELALEIISKFPAVKELPFLKKFQ